MESHERGAIMRPNRARLGRVWIILAPAKAGPGKGGKPVRGDPCGYGDKGCYEGCASGQGEVSPDLGKKSVPP